MAYKVCAWFYASPCVIELKLDQTGRNDRLSNIQNGEIHDCPNQKNEPTTISTVRNVAKKLLVQCYQKVKTRSEIGFKTVFAHRHRADFIPVILSGGEEMS